MRIGLYRRSIQDIRQAVTRAMLICSLATTLAATYIFVQEAQPVAAASASAIRHDRRPDRERPVATSQGSGTTTSSQSRPRLVCR
jgi:hypothetical protein